MNVQSLQNNKTKIPYKTSHNNFEMIQEKEISKIKFPCLQK